MIAVITQFFSQFPPELATFLMAITPVGELRLAIPVALLSFNLPVWQAYVLAVIGNLIPPLFILLFAGRFHNYIQKKSGFFTRGWLKYLERAQAKASGKYAKYGLIGLLIFVAIPFPLTGAWTGSSAAFVFGISFKRAWPYVFLGVLISGIITTILTIGVDKIF